MGLRQYNDLPDDLDVLGQRVVDCVFNVHKNLGAGYPERIYEAALCHEFEKRNIAFEVQKTIRVTYPPDVILDPEYRLDLVVEDKIILELKAVEKIAPVHNAQLLSYMRMAKIHLGYLINFNVPLIKDGINRRVIKVIDGVEV